MDTEAIHLLLPVIPKIQQTLCLLHVSHTHFCKFCMSQPNFKPLTSSQTIQLDYKPQLTPMHCQQPLSKSSHLVCMLDDGFTNCYPVHQPFNQFAIYYLARIVCL